MVDQSRIVKEIDQLNETLSTQHTKIYLADEKLILSGANLENAYFRNRQDRYIQFSSPSLVAYHRRLAKAIAKYSYPIEPDNRTMKSGLMINVRVRNAKEMLKKVEMHILKLFHQTDVKLLG